MLLIVNLENLANRFVFELEQYRLKAAGRDDLAQKVLWASRDIWRRTGFDILSLTTLTTQKECWRSKPLDLASFSRFTSRKEVRCSEDIPNQYKPFQGV